MDLYTVIRELVNSDKYYLNGDLGIKSDGTTNNDTSYLCKTFAEVLNAKKTDCKQPEVKVVFPGHVFSTDWEPQGLFYF